MGNDKSAPVPLKQPCRLWVNSHQKVTPKDHQELWHNQNKTKQYKTMGTLYGLYSINSLWSSATLRHRFGSTLVQVTACCLTAPSHYLDQCWLLIREVLWLSPKSNFKGTAIATFRYNESENYTFNPLRAKFFWGNINIYLHFMSSLQIDLTQVLKTLLQVREGPTYSI